MSRITHHLPPDTTSIYCHTIQVVPYITIFLPQVTLSHCCSLSTANCRRRNLKVPLLVERTYLWGQNPRKCTLVKPRQYANGNKYKLLKSMRIRFYHCYSGRFTISFKTGILKHIYTRNIHTKKNKVARLLSLTPSLSYTHTIPKQKQCLHPYAPSHLITARVLRRSFRLKADSYSEFPTAGSDIHLFGGE